MVSPSVSGFGHSHECSFTLPQMFGRKYQRLAESYPDATFLEIFGDDTKETRVWS